MDFLLRNVRFPAARRRRAAPTPPVIDVRQRAKELTEQELLQAADAYFAKFSTDSAQYKKPFSDPSQVVQLTQHLSLLFEAANLFRGAHVLDFGCSTGWLSLGMAQMGCEVVGVDIAASALRLAERLKASRRVPSDGRLEFRIYDGQRLPFADASMDRIVCCDSFHHVRDQAFVIREFARVLKQGGRVAFMEPGPQHSRTKQSQEEMRLHKILENDVSIPEIAQHARAAGLDAPQMLVQFPRTFQIGCDEFLDWSEKGIPVKRAHQMLRSLQGQLTSSQCFFMSKGETSSDSRSLTGLGADLKVMEMHPGQPGAGFCSLRFVLRNTGTATWLTQRIPAGQVRLGCQLSDAQDNVVQLDYARFDIPAQSVAPGAEVTVDVAVKLPSLPAYKLRFDLVSEHVAWFAQAGKSQMVQIASDSLVRRA